MKQANLVIGSKEVLATLSRAAASLIKSDGTTYTHLMHDIGMTEEEGYNVQLQIARSDSKAIPMPADTKEDHFKERCYVAQLSIKVVAEQRRQRLSCSTY